MAELAFGIAGNVIQKLGSVAYQEFSLAFGFKSDLEKLKDTMSIIREVLLDAEKKQASNPLLKTWTVKLNNVLHDAEDVLDEIEYQVLRKQVVATYGSTFTKVRHSFSSSMKRAFPFKLAHKIKGIRKKLDEIDAEKNQFNLTIIREDGHKLHQSKETTLSYVHPSYVIGRDEDKENIINFLMRPDGSKNVTVISIVGLGGLGKTTLAKCVCNDERVVGLFQLRLWVCVFKDFSVARLIEEILISVCNQIETPIDPSWNVNTCQTKLREILRDKKFLLVLDDVWNEDYKKWIELGGLLKDGSKGSKIIVTTRSKLVASTMETDYTHSLEGLSEEDCLSLFVQCAFNEGEKKQHPNLLKIGKEIVGKCEGVPLAVTALGCMLRSKVDEWEWEFVRDNELWKLDQKEINILPILKLSYDQMPIHLKQCFVFCSLFPKDYEFNSFDLIHLWMANGLLSETTSNKQDLEDVGRGRRYIKELLSRFFFQFIPNSIAFEMHDLIHDLAIFIAQGECLVVDVGTKDVETVHHLSFSKMGEEIPKCLDNLTNVRTVMPTTGFQPLPLSLVKACILKFKYLRLLNLKFSSFEVLPSSISNLKHLRYLNLSHNTKIKLLPKSICKLHNLQTLMLGGCSKLEQLPKDIRNMINLRSLVVTILKDTCLLKKGPLNSLRFLCVFKCSRLEVFSQGMDECLTNLRTLEISGCHSMSSLSINIKHLTALENLYIEDCRDLSLMGEEDNEALKPSLRSLTIISLPKLEVLPQWLQGSADLQHLRIESCENFTALPEWLPTLNSLHTLVIINCPELSYLPKGTDRLTKLVIDGCPKLASEMQIGTSSPDRSYESFSSVNENGWIERTMSMERKERISEIRRHVEAIRRAYLQNSTA